MKYLFIVQDFWFAPVLPVGLRSIKIMPPEPENTIKLEYDLYYIKHRSLLMDLSVIFHTLKTIFGLKGR